MGGEGDGASASGFREEARFRMRQLDRGLLHHRRKPGRDGKTGLWNLDPVDFLGTEPTTWLSDVIRNGLRPLPRWDVKSWKRNGTHVAVVMVDPVAEPPCMTTAGEVFVRVSGESVPVEDPAMLRRLIERGETRASQAEAEGLRAINASGADPGSGATFLGLRLAFAPTGRAEDITAVLFDKPFHEAMEQAARTLPSEPLFPYPGHSSFGTDASQDALSLSERTKGNRQRWTIRAAWDGSVALYLDIFVKEGQAGRLVATEIFKKFARPAATEASNLVRSLGGYGRSFVALHAVAREFSIISAQNHVGQIPSPNELLPIQTWTDSEGQLTDAQFDRMRRELLRASGVLVWESD